MSRLYYEKKDLVSLETTIEGSVPEVNANGSDFTDYLNKVSKLVPSEIIAGYLTMFGLVSAIKSPQLQTVFAWIVFAAGLILTPLYLNKVADADKPKRNHLIMSTIAFIVWAYVTTGSTLSDTIASNLYESAVASIILIIFSFFSALIPLNK